MRARKAFLFACSVFEKLFWNRIANDKKDCVQVILFGCEDSVMNRVCGNPFIIPENIGRFLYGYASSLGLDIAEILTRVINSAHESFEDDVEVEHEFK